MVWLENSELVDVLVAIEKERACMGHGYFRYGLGNGFLVVTDPVLTTRVGYENFAWRVRRYVDPKLWDVEVAVSDAVPQLAYKGRVFLRITPKEGK